jgi:hypothetical protein
MGVLGRQLMTGMACLAAFLTPLGEMPRIVCFCPNGQVKSFCLGFTSETSGCCCGGACCSRAAGGKGCCCCQTGCPAREGQGQKAACCAQPQARPASNSPAGNRCISGNACCLKALIGSTPFVLAPAKKAAGEPPSETALALPHANVRSLTHGARLAWSVQVHVLLPPADLVTLLGRLLI